jgi:hypothetical protein
MVNDCLTDVLARNPANQGRPPGSIQAALKLPGRARLWVTAITKCVVHSILFDRRLVRSKRRNAGLRRKKNFWGGKAEKGGLFGFGFDHPV